jgi:hypothetical protein
MPPLPNRRYRARAPRSIVFFNRTLFDGEDPMALLTLIRRALAAADRMMAALRRYQDISRLAATRPDPDALRRRMGLDA